MKIIKHQSGGIVYTPVSLNNEQPTTTQTSESKAEKISGTYAKELVDQIKEYGIQSDVNVFSNNVAKILELRRNPLSGEFNMADIVKIQTEANRVKINKETYNEAYKNLDAENSWSEAAITSSGRMYVLNENGQLDTITASDYHKNQDAYRLLTNSDLMRMRESQSGLAYNQGILHDMEASVGINSIVDRIKKIVKDFETTETQGYTKKQQAVLSGLNKLMEGGPDGIYKFTTKETLADQDVQYALEYLYKTMPTADKHTLDAKCAAEGGDPTSAKDRFAILGMILTAHTPRAYEVDYEKDASLVGGYTNVAAASKEALTEDTLPDRIARGDLQQTTAYISPQAERASDKAQMAITAWNAGPLCDDKYNTLYMNNLQELLPKVYGLRAVDLNQITFGNQVVDPAEAYKLVWDGYSKLTRVALPVKMGLHGEMVPNFDVLETFNKIQQYKKEHPGAPAIELKQMYNTIEDYVQIDETGNLHFKPERMGFFVTFAAYANRDCFDIADASKKYLEHLSKDRGANIKDEYNNLVQYGSLRPDKKSKKQHSINTAESRDFYHGNVYLPITDNTQGSLMSKSQFVPKTMYQDVVNKDLLGKIIQTNVEQDSYITNFNQ